MKIDDKVRIVSDITIDNQINSLWAEFDKKYEKFLCYERSDAFVVALLHYAMLHNHDIICDAPMDEDLFYQISTYTIEALTKWSPNMHKISVSANIDTQKLPCAGKVGTGISCGIDSFHALASHENIGMGRHRISHLLFNNTGSHGDGEKANHLYLARKRRIEKFCYDYHFELIECNSNIKALFHQIHILSHTYTSMFPVLCLQKLFSIYYYASGHTINDFSIKNTDVTDPAYYDFFLLSSISTSQLKLYSEGLSKSRLEKTIRVSKYIPSYNYLNVCTCSAENCGKCEKCCRTLLTLDAIGKLDLYKAVFNVDYYKKNKVEYLLYLEVQKSLNNIYYKEIYAYLKNDITFFIRLKAIPRIISGYKETLFSFFKKYLPTRIVNSMKKLKKRVL